MAKKMAGSAQNAAPERPRKMDINPEYRDIFALTVPILFSRPIAHRKNNVYF